MLNYSYYKNIQVVRYALINQECYKNFVKTDCPLEKVFCIWANKTKAIKWER